MRPIYDWLIARLATKGPRPPRNTEWNIPDTLFPQTAMVLFERTGIPWDMALPAGWFLWSLGYVSILLTKKRGLWLSFAGVPHTSFQHPQTSKDDLPRQSIEVRMLVYSWNASRWRELGYQAKVNTVHLIITDNVVWIGRVNNDSAWFMCKEFQLSLLTASFAHHHTMLPVPYRR